MPCGSLPTSSFASITGGAPVACGVTLPWTVSFALPSRTGLSAASISAYTTCAVFAATSGASCTWKTNPGTFSVA